MIKKIHLLTLLLVTVLALPVGTQGAVAGVPANDSTFYVNLVSDGTGVPMMLLPTELGLSYSAQYYAGAMGVLVSKGVVVEETDQAKMENTFNKKCGTVSGWACSGDFKVSGTYKDGHLTIISTNDQTYTYNGTPIAQGSIYNSDGTVDKTFAPTPIAPGNVAFKSETRYQCDAESATSFACSMTRTFVQEPTAECVTQITTPYPGAYGWDICSKARYTTKPQQTKTGTAMAVVAPLNGMAIVSEISNAEDIEVRRGASGEIIPARLGMVVKVGDTVSTLLDTRVLLDFGYATLEVLKFTQVTLDEYTNKDNISKTQLALRVGAVKSKIRHTNAIRSDFSVATPGANASIRGSEMQVSYDENTKETTVVTLEDKAYVKGTADANEISIPENKQITVDANGKSGALTPATVVAEGGASTSPKLWIFAGIAILLVAVGYGAIRLLRKK